MRSEGAGSAAALRLLCRDPFGRPPTQRCHAHITAQPSSSSNLGGLSVRRDTAERRLRSGPPGSVTACTLLCAWPLPSSSTLCPHPCGFSVGAHHMLCPCQKASFLAAQFFMWELVWAPSSRKPPDFSPVRASPALFWVPSVPSVGLRCALGMLCFIMASLPTSFPSLRLWVHGEREGCCRPGPPGLSPSSCGRVCLWVLQSLASLAEGREFVPLFLHSGNKSQEPAMRGREGSSWAVPAAVEPG